MGFGAYGVPMMVATSMAMNSARRSAGGYYGGGGGLSDDSSDTPKSRKWCATWLLIVSIIVGICVYGVFFQEESRTVDVTGTVFAKGIGHKHHKHYDEDIFVFAIKPDNPKWHKFDANVTFATYSSYNVGDKVKFNDIMKTEVGDKSWTVWDELFGCASFTIGIIAICAWVYFLVETLFYNKIYGDT